MGNELTEKKNALLSAPTAQQTDKNNFNVTNENGGVVNFNFNYSQAPVANSSATMMAVQSFSKEYYQLIVTCDEDVFKYNVITVAANRALVKGSVPQEIFERCSPLTDKGIAELKHFPAIICRENKELKGATESDQMAMYAYINAVQKVGKNIKIAFTPLMPFFQEKLCDKRNAIFFDLNMDCAITDLNHSAWTVHKVNVFEAFDEAGIPISQRPL